jgi:erythromycin esterase-like protein
MRLNSIHQQLRSHTQEIGPHRPGWATLLDRKADARIVCIGEASHGTEEFYRVRAELSKALIDAAGFTAVAVEADWPDAYRVNRYVRDLPAPADGHDASAEEALAGFERFPAWMWRNQVVREFVEWLRQHNLRKAPNTAQAGFYGIDLYSMYRSMEAVVHYLQKADPAAARRAKLRYGCFEQFAEDPQHYGFAAGRGIADPCESEVIAQLMDLQRRAGELVRRDGRILPDEYFYAEQNARLVKNAEEYYRSMYRGRKSSWNLRDTHMADTVDALLDYLNNREGQAKIIVWAHNSHLGDSRATEMGRRGELNVGQLLRERHPAETFHLGFTTNDGTVLAAHDWDDPPHVHEVRPGLEGSYEALFHRVGGDFWLPLQLGDRAREILLEAGDKLERAIGVIYRPETERQSHYFHARLPEQFDAVIHLDRTRALVPLDSPQPSAATAEEAPETYPSAV